MKIGKYFLLIIIYSVESYKLSLGRVKCTQILSLPHTDRNTAFKKSNNFFPALLFLSFVFHVFFIDGYFLKFKYNEFKT